jgi:hypothetical protein
MSLNKIRKANYTVARTLGDINAFQKGKVGKRVQRRIIGRIVGKLMGRILR